MVQNLDNTTFLNYALKELQKYYDLHEGVREAKRLAANQSCLVYEIESKLRDIGCFYCSSCKKWKKKKYMLEVSNPLTNGRCKNCAKDRYYTSLAKASICSSGLSLLTVPKELIEIEKLRVKIRHTLKNKK